MAATHMLWLYLVPQRTGKMLSNGIIFWHLNVSIFIFLCAFLLRIEFIFTEWILQFVFIFISLCAFLLRIEFLFTEWIVQFVFLVLSRLYPRAPDPLVLFYGSNLSTIETKIYLILKILDYRICYQWDLCFNYMNI